MKATLMSRKGIPMTNSDFNILSFYSTIGVLPFLCNSVAQLSDYELVSRFTLYTNDEVSNKLIGKIEAILFAAKENTLTKHNLPTFIKGIREYIIEKYAYRTFNHLIYVMYERANTAGTTHGESILYNCCMTLLHEVASYLYLGRAPLYFHSQTQELYITEVVRDLLNKSHFEFFKKVNSGNYPVSSEDKGALAMVDSIVATNDSEERIIRSRIILSHLLTERDEDIWEKELAGSEHIFIEMERWSDNETLRAMFKERNRFLRPEGEEYVIKNLPDYEEIFLQEKIYNSGEIYLLFSVMNSDKLHIIGVFNVNNGVFYSCLSDSNNTQLKYSESISNLENLILQLYAILVCGLVPHRKRRVAVKIYDSENDYKTQHYANQISLYPKASHEKHNTQKSTRSEVFFNHGVKTVPVQPYIRNLPAGYVASDEARNNAIKYGIILKEGTTFVEGFEKNVYVKE